MSLRERPAHRREFVGSVKVYGAIRVARNPFSDSSCKLRPWFNCHLLGKIFYAFDKYQSSFISYVLNHYNIYIFYKTLRK